MIKGNLIRPQRPDVGGVPWPAAGLLVSLLCVLALACGNQKELSRETAGRIIVRALNFPDQVTDRLQVGPMKVFGLASEQDYYTKDLKGKLYKSLAGDGLLTLKYGGTKQEPFMGFGGPTRVYLFEVSLTDKGRESQIGSVSRNEPDGRNYVVVQLCEKQFTGVTGIAFSEAKIEAQVDFTWKYGNFTPFGTRLREINGLCAPATEHQESVMMRLYDDGWRVLSR